MTAQITKESGPRPFVAWCERCQDGVRHHTVGRAREWASKHNADKHPEARQ